MFNTIKKIFTIGLSSIVIAGVAGGVTAPISTAIADAGLQVTVTGDKTQVHRGQEITYTVVVKNSGSSTQDKVTLAGQLSSGLSLKAGSTTYFHVLGSKTGTTLSAADTWIKNGSDFGSFKSGQYMTLKFTATVSNTATFNQQEQFTANVYSQQHPSYVRANHGTLVVDNTTPVIAKICADKKANKTTAQRGETITYTIEVCNAGNVTLHNVYVVDYLPNKAGVMVDYVAGSGKRNIGGEVVALEDRWITDGYKLPYLNAGKKLTITYSVKVKNSVANGTDLWNTANIKSDETPNWIQCSAKTTVVVKTTPTPTATPTPTPTPTATPTPTPTPDCSKEHKADDKCGEVIGATPTPTPIAELPSTGPGMAVVVALASTTAGLISRKYWLAR